uniref:MBL fold metallo-hydrolase n=1 Tax=Streptomyces parvulus TaxID=146923 RepID=UPI003F54865E
MSGAAGAGLLLFDTGMGAADDATEAHYRPPAACAARGAVGGEVAPDEITLVVNCHLHFDHCGGNPQPTGRPVLVQDREPAAARAATPSRYASTSPARCTRS